VHPQAVDVVDKARADAGRQHASVERSEPGHQKFTACAGIGRPTVATPSISGIKAIAMARSP
jgi:hypothetical protein